MDKLTLLIGRMAGIIGALLCVGSGLARLGGLHWFGGCEAQTIMQAGIAGMVLGCFCFLLVLSQDIGNR